MNINTINPSIISPQEELEKIINEYITPDKIRKITGINNLNEIRCLELKVDSRKTSIGNIGKILPNLSQLNLNNSYFESIRNLGSSFDKLDILWACNCSINELDGISSFNSLKKLYVNKNSITDIYSITMLDSLETLNIESNMIAEVEQLEYLALCSSLNNLTIRNNPITSKIKIMIDENSAISKQNKLNAYNQIIHDFAPNVTVLDGITVDMNKLNILTNEEIQNILKKANELATNIVSSNTNSKINLNKYLGIENEVEEASELTFGTSETVCGNPVLFLRSRRQELKQANNGKEKKKGYGIEINDKMEKEEEKIIEKNDEKHNNKNNDNIIGDDGDDVKNEELEKKKKLNQNLTKEKKAPNTEDTTEKDDKYSDIIYNSDYYNNISISSLTESEKPVLQNYQVRNDRKLLRRRSQTSIDIFSLISTSTETSSSLSSSFYVNSLKSKNNQPIVSEDSIYSISSSNCSNYNVNGTQSKLQLHQRSSTMDSSLDDNRLLNSSIKISEESSSNTRNNSTSELQNESLKKDPELRNENVKQNISNQASQELNESEKLKHNAMFTKIINFINHSENNNEFDDSTSLNNKKGNILIPHPPLNPIPPPDDENKPSSIPNIRRRMFKKKK